MTDMSNITSIAGPAVARIDAPSYAAGARAARTATSPGQLAGETCAACGDAVELSAEALDAGREQAVRQQLVDRVKAEIAAGVYETPEKLDKAAEGLARDLGIG